MAPTSTCWGRASRRSTGSDTLPDVEAMCRAAGERLGHEVECFQSNWEGALIDKIHEYGRLHKEGKALGCVFNPGAFTHTSVALHDAHQGHRRAAGDRVPHLQRARARILPPSLLRVARRGGHRDRLRCAGVPDRAGGPGAHAGQGQPPPSDDRTPAATHADQRPHRADRPPGLSDARLQGADDLQPVLRVDRASTRSWSRWRCRPDNFAGVLRSCVHAGQPARRADHHAAQGERGGLARRGHARGARWRAPAMRCGARPTAG